jgi:acetyl-CoA carboxylase biotin carboxylase subunit
MWKQLSGGGKVMFRKVLIANRGEIALRIVRACRELGVHSVIAYSEADRDSLAVRLADERICIGPGPSAKSYLNIPNIISAALITGAEAIHPGYGFLSENASFAEFCADCRLVFIGPTPSAIAQMGDKVAARQTMAKAGLPVLPGTPVLRSLSEAERWAEEIGFPLMVKSAAGGGGRGIRLVRRPEDLASTFALAQSEVRAAFQDDGLYLERYLERARHIEIQVLLDNYGDGVHLGERNCSLQRRHQKIMEEAPCYGLPPALREEMGRKALRAVQSIGYRSAGTLEFLVDEDYHYYFMEMNTRLQVEHPVTEMVTGIDIVQEQIRLASGEPMTLRQEDVAIRGHAIEFRINAEDCDLDFRPMTGTVEEYLPPGGPNVRVDSHLYRGYVVPPHYDSLLAKLIVWAPTRHEAIARGKRALQEFVIDGLKTTIPLHLQILQHPQFLEGDTYTGFLQDEVFALQAQEE